MPVSRSKRISPDLGRHYISHKTGTNLRIEVCCAVSASTRKGQWAPVTAFHGWLSRVIHSGSAMLVPGVIYPLICRRSRQLNHIFHCGCLQIHPRPNPDAADLIRNAGQPLRQRIKRTRAYYPSPGMRRSALSVYLSRRSDRGLQGPCRYPRVSRSRVFRWS